MNNFNSINGEGDFVLYVNGIQAQSISFSSEDKEAITFNISEFIAEHLEDIFAAGNEVTFLLTIENYENGGDEEGFKVSYSLNLKYYDLTPPPGNASLELVIDRDFGGNELGDAESQGKTFSYNF